MSNWILRLYRNRPVLANGISGFFIFSSGDLLSQLAVQKNRNVRDIEKTRVISVGLFGVGLNGLFLTHYYRLLDQAVGKSQKRLSTIVTKIIIDQIINAPICNILFFGFSSFYSGGHFVERIERFQHTLLTKLWSTWIADCSVWPFANVVNFKFIPVNFRPTWVGVCQIFWNAYLCGVAFGDSSVDESSKDYKGKPAFHA